MSTELFFTCFGKSDILKFIENGGGSMFRMWGKIWKDNHLLRDIVIENNKEDTRTHKVFEALDEICYAFDLGKPIWLDSCVADFRKHSSARFTKDSFIEQIDFDYLEIQMIEED